MMEPILVDAAFLEIRGKMMVFPNEMDDPWAEVKYKNSFSYPLLNGAATSQ